MKLLGILILCLSSGSVFSQKLDSLFFNLYTDSLKKGTYNYINVDGKFSNGAFLPLTEKELRFTSSAGSFDRNSLFIDSAIVEKKVRVKVYLKSDSTVSREITIYIKQHESTEGLKTIDEVMPSNSRKRKRSS